MVERSDKEFQAFVTGFGHTLARLEFLLTAGTNVDAATAATDALARVRRGWREAQTSGAPELLAIDALVAKLPRRERRRHDRALPALNDDSENRDDDARIRMMVWELWQTLSPRDRIPVLFEDPSVAAPRLAGVELPASAGSSRRLALVEKRAKDEIVAKLQTNPSTPTSARLLSEEQLIEVLHTALREHAATVPDLIDPIPLVARRAGSLRRRGYAIAGTVIGLLLVGALTALHVSNPKPPPPTTASPSTSGVTPDPSLLSASVVDAQAWARASGFPPSTTLVPLWGGTDVSSIRVVILRLETAGPSNGLAVDWYHDPGQAGSIDPNLYFSAHYLIAPGPFAPVAFPYATSRIGVLAPLGMVKAALVVNGHAESPVPLDASGFASLDATGTGQQSLQVALYGASTSVPQTLRISTPAPD